MKTFFIKIWNGLEFLGRARAAGYMVRQGDAKGAVKLMDGVKTI